MKCHFWYLKSGEYLFVWLNNLYGFPAPWIVTRKLWMHPLIFVFVFVCRMHFFLYWNIAICGLTLAPEMQPHIQSHTSFTRQHLNIKTSEQKHSSDWVLPSLTLFQVHSVMRAYFRVLTKCAAHHTFNFQTSCIRSEQLSSVFIEFCSNGNGNVLKIWIQLQYTVIFQ